MKKYFFTFLIATLLLTACQATSLRGQDNKKSIVVTYAILGAVVKDLVGTNADVVVLIPNGQDPHEWQPSARDIETLNKADLVVQNGLGLEAGLEKTIALAAQQGVKVFTASDHITVRKVGAGEGIPSSDPTQQVGMPDPHLWTDPLSIRQVVSDLSSQLKSDLNLDLAVNAQQVEGQLDSLNAEITTLVDTLPQANRKLVTGHESLGYFANRYGFKLVGAIIPSLSSQAEVSASSLAGLKQLIQENQAKAIFTELGTPPAIAQAIGQETGVKVVELATHSLPSDGSYYTYMRNLAKIIVDNLK